MADGSSSRVQGQPDPSFEQSLSGTDAAQLLLQTDEHKVPTSASSDGRFLLYTAMSPRATRFDLWVLPLKGDRKPFPFLRREFDQQQGQFSPDGRWVAYVSNESGRHEVLVRPFTPAGAAGAVESSVVSKGGGTSPRWGANGKELYYLAPNGTVTSVAFATIAVCRLALRESCSRSLAPPPTGQSRGTANDFFSPRLPATVRRRRSRSSSTGRRL